MLSHDPSNQISVINAQSVARRLPMVMKSDSRWGDAGISDQIDGVKRARRRTDKDFWGREDVDLTSVTKDAATTTTWNKVVSIIIVSAAGTAFEMLSGTAFEIPLETVSKMSPGIALGVASGMTSGMTFEMTSWTALEVTSGTTSEMTFEMTSGTALEMTSGTALEVTSGTTSEMTSGMAMVSGDGAALEMLSETASKIPLVSALEVTSGTGFGMRGATLKSLLNLVYILFVKNVGDFSDVEFVGSGLFMFGNRCGEEGKRTEKVGRLSPYILEDDRAVKQSLPIPSIVVSKQWLR